MRINKAIEKILKENKDLTKYALSKRLGIQQIMINNYLLNKIKSPNERVAKSIYKEFGIVVFPFMENELKVKE